MNVVKQDDSQKTGAACCGGPVPADISVCCIQDTEVKSSGAAGCGNTQSDCDAPPVCCGTENQTPLEPGVSSHTHRGREGLVRQHYGRVAEQAVSCCSGPTSDTCGSSQAPGYSAEQLATLPEGANMGLGCGNPHAIAALKPGERVLDLGCGAGIDCFLAAHQIGETGHVIGIDMTPEMLVKARANHEKSGFSNIEFRLAEIEHLPVADASIDVILSNCVINLSPDKSQVFAEAWRVLRPGGRLAVSDIVATAELPAELKRNDALYTGCMAGASLVSEVEAMLAAVGFEQVRVTPKDESKVFIRDWSPDTSITDYIVSATIEAVKPSKK